jgi:hypothetical protein
MNYKMRKVTEEKIEILDAATTTVALGLQIPGGRWVILINEDFATAHSLSTIVSEPFWDENAVLSTFLRQIPAENEKGES